MAIADMFRVGKIKDQLEQVQKERDVLRATMSEIENMTYFDLKIATADLKEQKQATQQSIVALEAELNQKKQRLNDEIDGLTRKLEAIQGDIKQQTELKRQALIVLDDDILLQSFGVYTPKYNLVNSEAYKTKLDQLRQQQEQLIKAGKAAYGSTNWQVNNSLKEGERMVKDYVTVILRSFNNECDASISNVKFSNVDAMEKRIRKVFDTLNKLGTRMSIVISSDYFNLKIQELYLCHEYQIKKQEEKEEQKLLREKLREEAKALKEIEEMKLKLGKEEKHFIKAMQLLDAQLLRADTDAERSLLETEKATIQEKLSDVEHTKQDILNREHNTRAGYVYVISNVGAFGPDIYKIGVTRRLDPQERVDELGDASVPFDFDIHALIFSDDAPALEHALHKAFESRRLNMINRRREFFNVTLEEIKNVTHKHFRKPVEFIELADAAEYRQSLLLKHDKIAA